MRRTPPRHSGGETLDKSSQHSSSNNNAVGIRSTRDGATKCPGHGARFSSGVDVIAEWDRHLARVNRDDVVFVAGEHVTGPRRSFAQAPRSFSRIARFAIEDSGGGGGGGGNDTIGRGGKGAGPKGDGHPRIYYGQMKDIVASGRQGIKGSGAGLWGEEEEDNDDEEEDVPTFLDRYDGSLASLKSLVFPPSITDRPVKRLFHAAVLASTPTSPAKSMTATELDSILCGLRGWKNGGGAGDSRRRARATMRTRKSAGYGGGGDKPSCGTATCREEGELRRVSTDNSALRSELFTLAKGERRDSLLFKRAFLNAEGGSVSSRQ